MRIKAVIFDLDGTLIDSSDGIVKAFNYALKQFNLPDQPAERITPMIGFSLESMFQELAGKSMPEMKRAFRMKAMETIVVSSRPLGGVKEVVESLFDNGYKMGIATTKIREHINGILEKLEWANFFEAVIGGDEVTQVKPHPEQFEVLLKRMNLGCESVVVVGDTTNDILAARQLGITEIAVRSPYGNSIQVQQLKPYYFLEDIDELPDILNELNLRDE